MSPRRRVAVIVAAAGCAATVLVSVLALLAPDLDPHIGAWAGPLGVLLPRTGIAVWNAIVGAVGLALALLALSRPEVFPRLRAVAAGVAALLAVGIVGGTVAMAGYVLAMALPVAVIAALVLLARARPVVGIALLIVVGAIGATAAVRFNAGSVVTSVVAATFARLPQLVGAAVAIAAIGGWIVALVLPGADGHPPALGRWALAHRRLITVAAALCAVPYAVARLSWLTPWPLLGPDAETLDAWPEARLLGLMLGAVMITGGILTIGLISRWGRRFPAWLPGLGGRDVPTPLAVIPGATAATLMTVGGIDMVVELLSGGTGALDPVVGILVLPFWLWGPLLGLATWGYALARAEERQDAVR
jgi:hypothetical protein